MRIPIQQVVDAAPIVIDENDPDLVFLSPKKVITTKNGKASYDKYMPYVPGGGGGNGPGDGPDDPNPPEPPNPPGGADTPTLSDIESVTYEQYYDSSNKARIKAIIKIRNSSSKSQEVEGVDARIYDPST
jgi:hypothetical protein